MNKVVHFGLIGAGGVGAYHRRSIEAMEAAGKARLVAIADPWPEKLAEQKAQADARGIRWHLDYREMLRLELGLDAVVIATPIPYHFEMAMACLERGLKIHLEKPPVPLESQFAALVAADNAQAISVGFQMIGAQSTQLLKAAICEGKIGTLREISAVGCWPRRDRYYSRAPWAGKMTLDGEAVFDGPATNAFAHLVNNAMYFAGEERDNFGVPFEVEAELYRARPMEAYDTACMRARFGSGVNFTLAVTHATEAQLLFKMEVRGDKGWARLSEDGARVESSFGLERDCAQDTQELLDIHYLNFLGALNDGGRYSTRLADCAGYVRATNAMLSSSQGIRGIAGEFVRKYEQAGEAGYDVRDLREAVEETFQTGQLFGEQGRPWATIKPRTFPIPPDGFPNTDTGDGWVEYPAAAMARYAEAIKDAPLQPPS